MTRTTTRMIVAVAVVLISALAIAQTPQAPPPQPTTPPATTTAPVAPAAQPAQTAPTGSQTQPAQMQPSPSNPTTVPVQAPPPQEPGPGPSSPVPTGPVGPPSKGSLSAPSMQAAPAPQGCTAANDDKHRVSLKASCGYLVDANGKPAPNVSLELVESGQGNAYLFVFSQTITDVNGRFDFGPVPSGHYLLRTHEGAPITVYNFISLPTKNAGSNCEHPVEVKAAAVGQCNSEVHAGKGTFSIETSPKKPKESKPSESKNESQQQPPSH